MPGTGGAAALPFPPAGAGAIPALRRISLCEKHAKSRDLLVSALSLALGRESTTSRILGLQSTRRGLLSSSARGLRSH